MTTHIEIAVEARLLIERMLASLNAAQPVIIIAWQSSGVETRRSSSGSSVVERLRGRGQLDVIENKSRAKPLTITEVDGLPFWDGSPAFLENETIHIEILNGRLIAQTKLGSLDEAQRNPGR